TESSARNATNFDCKGKGGISNPALGFLSRGTKLGTDSANEVDSVCAFRRRCFAGCWQPQICWFQVSSSRSAVNRPALLCVRRYPTSIALEFVVVGSVQQRSVPHAFGRLFAGGAVFDPLFSVRACRNRHSNKRPLNMKSCSMIPTIGFTVFDGCAA